MSVLGLVHDFTSIVKAFENTQLHKISHEVEALQLR